MRLTVEKLIEELSKFPKDATIVYSENSLRYPNATYICNVDTKCDENGNIKNVVLKPY